MIEKKFRATSTIGIIGQRLVDLRGHIENEGSSIRILTGNYGRLKLKWKISLLLYKIKFSSYNVAERDRFMRINIGNEGSSIRILLRNYGRII